MGCSSSIALVSPRHDGYKAIPKLLFVSQLDGESKGEDGGGIVLRIHHLRGCKFDRQIVLSSDVSSAFSDDVIITCHPTQPVVYLVGANCDESGSQVSVCEIKTDDDDDNKVITSLPVTSQPISCCVCLMESTYWLYVASKDWSMYKLNLTTYDWTTLEKLDETSGDDNRIALLCIKNSMYALSDTTLYKMLVGKTAVKWEKLLSDMPGGKATVAGDSVYVLDKKNNQLHKCDPLSKAVTSLDWIETEMVEETVHIAGIGYNYIYMTGQSTSSSSIADNGNDTHTTTITQLTLDRKQSVVAGYVSLPWNKYTLLLCMTSQDWPDQH